MVGSQHTATLEFEIPYCMMYSYADEVTYILFDLPGQVELFTLHNSLRHIVDTLTDKWSYRSVG